jgi:hypothetical protein
LLNCSQLNTLNDSKRTCSCVREALRTLTGKCNDGELTACRDVLPLAETECGVDNVPLACEFMNQLKAKSPYR